MSTHTPGPRYEVETDGLTMRPRFSRRYAVVDTIKCGRPAMLETDDPHRAREFAYELNCEARAAVAKALAGERAVIKVGQKMPPSGGTAEG